MTAKRRGKRIEPDPAVQAELDARHLEVDAELAAARSATEGTLGFTRRAFVYWMAVSYDMLADEVGDGFTGDREAFVSRLFEHVAANFGGLVGFPVGAGGVLDADGFDEDDPDSPDL